jgi:hypothetical protein
LVANRDEERGDVFAVLAGLLERRARAVGRDAFAPEFDRRLVGFRIRALDAPGGARVRDGDALYDPALLVVEASQKRSSSEESAETAIGKSGQSVSNRRQAVSSRMGGVSKS